MKGMFESAETFMAYATIDAGEYMLRQLLNRMMQPKSGLEIAIDKATGYDKEEYEQWCKEALIICVDVVKAKVVIGVDCTAENTMIADLQNHLKTGEPLTARKNCDC